MQQLSESELWGQGDQLKKQQIEGYCKCFDAILKMPHAAAQTQACALAYRAGMGAPAVVSQGHAKQPLPQDPLFLPSLSVPRLDPTAAG